MKVPLILANPLGSPSTASICVAQSFDVVSPPGLMSSWLPFKIRFLFCQVLCPVIVRTPICPAHFHFWCCAFFKSGNLVFDLMVSFAMWPCQLMPSIFLFIVL